MNTYLRPEGLVDQTCRKCETRPATAWMQVGAIDVFHGGAQPWCDICVLEAQLGAAQDAAACIPEIEARLAALRGEAPSTLLRITLELTPAEAAVLSYLVSADPEWGDPLKDIEDSMDDPAALFAAQPPYKAMRDLRAKWKRRKP